MVEQIFSIIKSLNETGTTILLVEQNASMALAIADRGYVLETGRMVLAASAEELLETKESKKHIWAAETNRTERSKRFGALFALPR